MIANFDSMSSCKTSYNVQSHSHWGLGQFLQGEGGVRRNPRGGGIVKKRESPDFRSPDVGISVNGFKSISL